MPRTDAEGYAKSADTHQNTHLEAVLSGLHCLSRPYTDKLFNSIVSNNIYAT